MIMPGGGPSPDGLSWFACRAPGSFACAGCSHGCSRAGFWMARWICTAQAISRSSVISNARRVSADAQTVDFGWKDYRMKSGDRQKIMRLGPRPSSSAASGAMYCPTVSIASGITACWPVRRASPTSEQSAPRYVSGDRNRPPRQDPTPRSSHTPCANRAPARSGPMRIIDIFRCGQKPISRAPPRKQAT